MDWFTELVSYYNKKHTTDCKVEKETLLDAYPDADKITNKEDLCIMLRMLRKGRAGKLYNAYIAKYGVDCPVSDEYMETQFSVSEVNDDVENCIRMLPEPTCEQADYLEEVISYADRHASTDALKRLCFSLINCQADSVMEAYNEIRSTAKMSDKPLIRGSFGTLGCAAKALGDVRLMTSYSYYVSGDLANAIEALRDVEPDWWYELCKNYKLTFGEENKVAYDQFTPDIGVTDNILHAIRNNLPKLLEQLYKLNAHL